MCVRLRANQRHTVPFLLFPASVCIITTTAVAPPPRPLFPSHASPGIPSPLRSPMMDPYYGKARKPYVPIDTCSPGGTWVEERRYNRVRPTVTGAAAAAMEPGASGASSPGADSLTAADRRPRRVLCGNWQEEDALERDLLAIQEAQLQQQHKQAGGELLTSSSAPVQHMQTFLKSGWNPTATMEVITEKPNGIYTGGHTSTPYLTCDSRHPAMRSLDSTYRVEFSSTSSNVASLRRPDLGVRSQRLMEQARVAAKEMQAASLRARQEQQQLREASMKWMSRSCGPNVSEYRATMCDENEVLPIVEELSQDYLSDEPITLYTGNPNTGKTMEVHGKTPVDPVSSSRFGKHTHFSEFKYAY
ncbi:conserved hypothetical protein [Leishmania infantum JPCM5]|uniref:Uncharacterized protein n=3 Tax=Leishmania donovani species complex TaxID=38574 RepID=A4HS77_LEIIN|nr:conserved hypothetical protein [Leishmania infantum JPCM5]CAC9441652.1 hypothetical_protein_-_conserved [Leishmania infantum]CAM65105.1 conserved hypothetical protein [Leishmania infantum JPCM5]SUZ38877.1 hypothetical_protein_-_conserved [Leishmania infantum]|eukprot:XP_001462919.1 conserved hypothetical protein [Leishmania infantum JPCM5]